jgi:hypothetical protein
VSAHVETPAKHRARASDHSALLLDFGAPLLEPLPATAPLSLWRDALSLVLFTWNALVLDEGMALNARTTETASVACHYPEQGSECAL